MEQPEMETKQKLNFSKPYVVGIAGGSASGKSRFLRQLAQLLPQKVTVLSFDDFYKPEIEQLRDENGYPNFDIPQSVDLQAFLQCLQNLKKGKNVKIKEYHFNNPNQKIDTFKDLKAQPIILLEGLFIFHFPEVFTQLDLSIFIHADEEIRFARRMARDTSERGISPEMVSYQWNFHVKPSFQLYLAPYKNQVDLVVNNNESFQKTLHILHQHLLNIQ